MSLTAMFVFWIIFLFLSMLFSGIDVAFVTSDKLRHAVSRKEKGAYNFMLNSIYGHPRQFLSTMMVGKVFSLLILVYFSYIIIISLLENSRLSSDWLSVLIVIVACSLLVIIIGELMPSAIFKRNSNAWVRALAFPAFLFYLILYPIAGLFIVVSKAVLRIFGISAPKSYEKTFGRVDLDEYVRKSFDELSDESDIESEVKIFRNALDFSTMKLRDCMVPRADIVAVDVETDAETLKDTFIQTGISRILVYKNDIDDIVGYIHMWEMFSIKEDWTNSIASISFVPESMLASRLMSDLMQQRKSIAVVIDEFGGTSGIVTMEDLVEEIFGEIEDEYDVKSKFIKQESDNEFVLSGRVELDHLNEKYGLDIPESDDYSTVAGYLLHHTQRFPKTYESIVIGKYTFKILKVTERKIEVVRIII